MKHVFLILACLTMVNSRRLVFASLIIAIACALAISPASLIGRAQQSTPSMVVLNVRVRDAEGRSVADLTQDSFVVTENGVAQMIALFSKNDLPLCYGLLIDSSGSFETEYKGVVAAAERIIKSNKPTDETFIVRFVDSDQIETTHDLTTNKEDLIAALELLHVSAGQTAIFDALYLSVEHLAKRRPGPLRRRALIVITDGEERNSHYSAAKLFQFLTAYDVQISILGYTRELSGGKLRSATGMLSQVASHTGGLAFFPSSMAELHRLSGEIVNELSSQYTIGYVPSAQQSQSGSQRVQVSMKGNSSQDNRVLVTNVNFSIPTK
jgi:Ca-activated chloride channel homolog